MPFRTITAKYAGICNRCNRAIAPGQQIRYAGPRQTWHLKAECPANDGPQHIAAAPIFDPATMNPDAEPQDYPTHDRSQMADF